VTTDDRRAAVLAAKTVNGVDFVEVDPLDNTTLVVHFILNLPGSPADQDPVPAAPGDLPTAGDFQISGGERITGIKVISAVPRPGTYDQMNVVVDIVGDFSVYTLTLQDTSVNPTVTPAGFDPASASANFVFHIECASDFDCAATAPRPPATVVPPPINYLAKDYPGFVQVMLDRLALLAPLWQERNPADLGVAIVEMLAYVADQLSYRQDVIATEAYLGTARLRTSVRRHARLVDYQISEGANSRAWLRILLEPGAPDGIVLPAGTRCATPFPGAPASILAHESLAYQQAISSGAVFFETTADSDPLSASLTKMPLYAWSDSQSCLAPGATHATLTGAFPALAKGMVLVLAEARGPLTGDPADADPGKRQAVRLTNVVWTVDPVTTDPDTGNPQRVTEIDWDPADALTFPLCVSSITDPAHGEQQIIGVSVAWGNIVLADQGRCIGGASDPTSTGPESVGVAPPTGQGSFRPSLANAPLTFAAPLPGSTAAAAAAVGPQGTPTAAIALTSVDVDGNTAKWSVIEDLLDASIGPMTAVFVPEVETDGTAYLLFGDGTNGLQPEPGTAFTATYRVGNGKSGNVARETITLIDLPAGLPSGVTGVTNPLPAWGGVDPETVDHVRQSAPAAFKTQQRAVTAADYQAQAISYPGVQRAAAMLRWTGSWYTVFITVERDQQAALDAQFIAGLEAYLGSYRMAGVDLEVEDGNQVPLLIQMSVCVQPGYVATDVEQALLAIFNAQVQPDGTPGLFNPGRLNLGQPFYLSPLIAAAQAVDGVTSAQITTFERQDQPSNEGLLAGVLIPQSLEFFVLDNDPNYPERGRFELTMEGGL
jgi:Baseplate J-like protein